MGANYLVTPLPRLPDDNRSALGIFQTDIIVRTAIIAGLADIRANPKLLDYCFASLPKDRLTFQIYGEEEVAKAKKWFLETDIPVFMNTKLDESKVPCITLAQNNSQESAAVLGDINYQTSQADIDETPITYGGPFVPVSYTASTGTIVMPSTFTLEVFPGQYIRDAAGVTHQIQDVLDPFTFVIETNANANFNNFSVVSAPAATSASLEVVEFREVIEIGAHALADPNHLTYLYSILLFVLYRYKQALLEARGFERTSWAAGPVALNTSFSTSQPVFTRMGTLTGFVRQYWPKYFGGPVYPTFEVDEINQDNTTSPIFEDDSET